MTQYNVKLSNSQLNKLKSAIKNKTYVVLDYHQTWLATQMMRLIFLKSYF